MESVMISSEKVKPSSPTPQNLRSYKFSMMDQFVPSMLVPVVLFFTNNNNSSDPISCGMLKQSLSSILTRYYPLAGRVNRDTPSIDCNDEGVPFTVSMSRGHKLSDFLQGNPDYNSLLPRGDEDRVVAEVQLNRFDCGGVAIGAVFMHKAVDAVTISAFLNSWAAATRGACNQPVCPNYIFQSMFPWKDGDQVSEFSPPEHLLKTGKSVMRRYVFNESVVSLLKSESGVDRPSRVEVVTALIWKCFMAACLANNVSASVVSQAVNLRRRAAPPFSSDCFGNMLGSALATSGNGGSGGWNVLVGKLRDAIREVDCEYVERMRGDQGHLGLHNNIQLAVRRLNPDAHYLGFTSWAGLGFYSVDFGWGKPIWVAKCDVGRRWNSAFFNEVSLMDTRNGDGIEAWINLEQKYMCVFEKCEDLRAFASCDPSPLGIP